MIAAKEIKSIVLGFGADKCGIANVARLDCAPAGFHPCNVYSRCKSVCYDRVKNEAPRCRTGGLCRPLPDHNP